MSTVDQQSRLLEPGRMIELFEFDLSFQGAEPPDNMLYLHPYVNLDGGTLAFMGQTWQPFPIQLQGVDFTTQGTVARPKVVVGNVNSVVTALLRLYGDFVGCKVTRRRTYTQFLDDGTEPGSGDNYEQYAPDIFSVERKELETPTSVSFELSAAWDAQNVSLPRRQILAGFCPWGYRSPECSYVGAPVADKDDKLIDIAHVPTQLTTVDGDAAVVIPSGAVRFTLLNVGGRIAGAGIPFGTKIESVQDDTHATMTATATASATIAAIIYAAPWLNTVSYNEGDWVYTGTQVDDIIDTPTPGGPPEYYRSLADANHDALSNAAKWYKTGQAYDAAHTYVLGDFAYVLVNGIRVYYASLADANTSPLSDKTKWVRDDCSKRVNACKLRFGALQPLPFGGFPGAGKIPTGG